MADIDLARRNSCVLCEQPLAGRSVAHLADGRKVCRGCYDRTRLHRAAAKVELVPVEPSSGMPAPSVCSAIHESLGDADDASEASCQTSAVVKPATSPLPVTREKTTPGRIGVVVELKPSILRRAIDAWLGKSRAKV